MGEWKTYRLGDICTLVAGFAFKSKDFGDYPDKVIKIADIQPPIVDMSSLTGIDISQYNCQKLEKYKTQKGDYVLAMTGATIGKLGRIVSKKNAYINQRVLLFKPIDKYIDKNYLYYYLCQNTFFSHIRNHIDSETAQPNISANSIGEFTLTLPPLDEQRRIAGILGSLDDKIELNRRINANLEAQAQALFRSWFVDFEPFRDGPFVDSELGKIPQGWKVGDIYTYMDVIYGAPYKSALFNADKKGYPLIRIRDLKTYSPQFYTEEILPNTEYVDFGDIVAGMDAEFVPYTWKGKKGLLNQRVCKFIPKYDYVSKYYILSLIRPELEFVQSYKVGTTVSHLGKSDIDKFKVITPPAEIVKRFSCIVDSFHQQIIKLAKENLNLSALRDTLLPKLMAGEINLH